MNATSWSMPVLALLLASCAEDHTAARRHADQVDDVAHQVGTSVSAYCTDGVAVPTDCPAEWQVHSAEVDSQLDRLQGLAPAFDHDLESLGFEELADVECGVLALRAELERHGTVACASTDASAGAAELSEHCAAMLSVASQLHERAESVLRATTHMSYSNSGAMSGVPRQMTAPEHSWPWGEPDPEPAPICDAR